MDLIEKIGRTKKTADQKSISRKTQPGCSVGDFGLACILRSGIRKLAALPMPLSVGEWLLCPHHLCVTPALWDAAAPLETGGIPIICMP